MSEYTPLSDDDAKALRRFLFLRDRLITLNLQAATMVAVSKLATARLPHVTGDGAATRALRDGLLARRESARRLHAGLAAGSARIMRRLIRARRVAGLDRRDG